MPIGEDEHDNIELGDNQMGLIFFNILPMEPILVYF